jgi:hypothetical protein
VALSGMLIVVGSIIVLGRLLQIVGGLYFDFLGWVIFAEIVIGPWVLGAGFAIVTDVPE